MHCKIEFKYLHCITVILIIIINSLIKRVVLLGEGGGVTKVRNKWYKKLPQKMWNSCAEICHFCHELCWEMIDQNIWAFWSLLNPTIEMFLLSGILRDKTMDEKLTFVYVAKHAEPLLGVGMVMGSMLGSNITITKEQH